MLNNKADAIEEYILKLLQENEDKQVELKRTDLADEVSCAPSQVSYVLSTRFTNAQGFKVESRRGLGGYIRITLVEDPVLRKAILFKDILRTLDEKTSFEEIRFAIDVLLKRKIITVREAELVAQMSFNLYKSENAGRLSASERAKIIHSIFSTLSKIT